MSNAARRKTAAANARLGPLAAQLHALSPTAILQRGYALVYDAKGALLRDIAGIAAGDTLTTQLAHGSFESRVTHTQSEKEAKPSQ
jgi:exodeoxyribonuclease VII large subunit